ncbi:MAG: hypothetical protein KDI68_14920 [Gammaproteobacteria bacterium]|nr:hypothetical protein [Gammaproteobacteria bacterium]
MLSKKSRYRDALPFAGDSRGETVFRGLRARPIGAATGVVEHEVKVGDRLDRLAHHYYNDDRLWWRIVDANPEVLFGQLLLESSMAGRVILIPKARE